MKTVNPAPSTNRIPAGCSPEGQPPIKLGHAASPRPFWPRFTLFIMALALVGCSAAITRNALPADPIGGAAVSSLIRGSGVGDAYKLYLISERDEFAYRVAWIPSHVPCRSNEDFDPVYMRCLFDFGGEELRRGGLWSELPPYFVRPPNTRPSPSGRTGTSARR